MRKTVDLTARLSVPSGASAGTREVVELRDEDTGRYDDKSYLRTEKRTCQVEEMVDDDNKLLEAYPICLIEDLGNYRQRCLCATAAIAQL